MTWILARVRTFSSGSWDAGAAGSAIAVHHTGLDRKCDGRWENVARDGAMEAA
jgi:hypothetical protein